MTQLTYDSGFQVNKYGSGDILPSPGLTEEGSERVIVASHRFVAGHLAVWLDAVLQTVELPAGVPHLNTSLAYVDRDALTLKERRKRGWDLERHRGGHWLYYFMNLASFTCRDLGELFAHYHLVEAKTYIGERGLKFKVQPKDLLQLSPDLMWLSHVQSSWVENEVKFN